MSYGPINGGVVYCRKKWNLFIRAIWSVSLLISSMITVNLYTSSLCCMFNCHDTTAACVPVTLNQGAPYFDWLFSQGLVHCSLLLLRYTLACPVLWTCVTLDISLLWSVCVFFFAILPKQVLTDSKLHRGNTMNGAYKVTLTITSLQVDTMQLCIACFYVIHEQVLYCKRSLRDTL